MRPSPWERENDSKTYVFGWRLLAAMRPSPWERENLQDAPAYASFLQPQ